jgi:inosine-uridine nucleoside N-ribohydrolase
MSDVPRRILMDVDTGTDDALAILYAIRHPDLEVIGISCVAGNVPTDQVMINTWKVLDAAGAGDIPVAAGALQPLIERARRTTGNLTPAITFACRRATASVDHDLHGATDSDHAGT